eukprot:sb/3473671/
MTCSLIIKLYLVYNYSSLTFCSTDLSQNIQYQEPSETSKQPIRTRYLGHVTGYPSDLVSSCSVSSKSVIKFPICDKLSPFPLRRKEAISAGELPTIPHEGHWKLRSTENEREGSRKRGERRWRERRGQRRKKRVVQDNGGWFNIEGWG